MGQKGVTQRPMPFTIEDFQDLIRLLGEHPEWQAELRRHVLSEELLELPALVRQLVEAQTRTEQRLEQLAAAQVRTEQRLEQFITRVDTMERDLSNLRSEFRGYRLEWRYFQRPSAYFGPLLRRLRLVWPSEAVDQFDDRLPRWAAEVLLHADLLVTGVPRYQPDLGEVWLVVEISARIDRNDVERALRRAEALRAAGLHALPAVAGERTTQGAKSAVQEQTVVLFKNGTVEGWEEALQRWAS